MELRNSIMHEQEGKKACCLYVNASRSMQLTSHRHTTQKAKKNHDNENCQATTTTEQPASNARQSMTENKLCRSQ